MRLACIASRSSVSTVWGWTSDALRGRSGADSGMYTRVRAAVGVLGGSATKAGLLSVQFMF